MPPSDTNGRISTAAGGSVRFVGRAVAAQLPGWRQCLVNQRKDYRYYEVLEETLEERHEYLYCVVEDACGEVLAIQPLFVVEQDMVAGSGPAVRRAAALVRRVFPRFLVARTIMVGCAAGEGHLDRAGGERANGNTNGQGNAHAGRVLASLQEGVGQFARRIGARLVVFKEFPASYRPHLAPLTRDGYTRVPSMPMTRLNIDHPTFDDLLATSMGKATRKSLRRKLKAAARAAPLEMSVVEDAAALADEVYPLYLQVYNRSKFQFEKLSRGYLGRVGSRMPDKTRFFVWRHLGKVVAFSLCMVHGDAIYDEYLGMDYSVAFDLHLYFISLCGILTWGMANGYKWYYSTSLGYDPKLHLGCELVPLDLYVRHTWDPLNFVLRRLLPWLGPARLEPTLKRFGNYSSLRGDA